MFFSRMLDKFEFLSLTLVKRTSPYLLVPDLLWSVLSKLYFRPINVWQQQGSIQFHCASGQSRLAVVLHFLQKQSVKCLSWFSCLLWKVKFNLETLFTRWHVGSGMGLQGCRPNCQHALLWLISDQDVIIYFLVWSTNVSFVCPSRPTAESRCSHLSR